MDYSIYQFSKKELVKYLLLYIVLDGVISYLFFASWIAFFLLLPGSILFLKEQKKTLQKKRAGELKRQFLDGLQMISASLQAGYSVENALSEALQELSKVYEQDAFIVREFRMMATQIAMNRSMEELFLDFGRRSAIDDIQSFAEVFLTAKRSGGDLLVIIRNTTSCIQQKEETLQEIETCLAGKAMEQNIMSVVPIGILAYVKLTSPEFVSALYGNLTGTIVMSICFVVYVIAYFWGRKIVRIEV
jgi:tight adherence protein B